MRQYNRSRQKCIKTGKPVSMFFELLWMMKNSQLLTTKCRWISRTCPIAHIDRTIKANIETVRGWLAGHTPAKK
jgi:hypothetical protein